MHESITNRRRHVTVAAHPARRKLYELEVVRVAGHHHLHLESPQAVYEVIERFLDRDR